MKTAYHVNNDDYYTIPDTMNAQEIENLKQLCKKNTFQCPFCKAFFDAPSGDLRYPYFRHRHSESCDAAEEFDNRSSKYSDQVKRESERHPVVISFLKDELKLLEPLYDNLKVIDGIFDPNFKKYIPDLVVTLNSTAYTIQVITHINDATDENLSKQLKKRKQYYTDKGYVPLWFVERGHAAKEVSGKEIVLWQSEQVLLQQTLEDKKWSAFLQSFTTNDLLTKVMDLNKPLESLTVQSIYYLSAKDNAKFDLYRSILENYTFPKRAFIVGEPYELTIKDVFKVEANSFKLEKPLIDEASRITFKSNYDQLHSTYIQKQIPIPKPQEPVQPAILPTVNEEVISYVEPEWEQLSTIQISEQKAAEIEEYKHYLRNFSIENERASIPAKYVSLFDTLIEKYQLNTVNFPGICKTKLFGYKDIPLPVSLWQLWVVDKIFTTYQLNDLTVFTLSNSFSHQFKIKGINSWKLKDALHNYLLKLEEAGILGHKKSEAYSVPFPVNQSTLHLIESFKENSYIAFYLSNYYYADDPFGITAKESFKNYKELIRVEPSIKN